MIERILTYNIVSWYGNLTIKMKNKLTQVINEANKSIGHKQSTLQELFSNFMEKKALASSDCFKPNSQLGLLL